MGVTDGREILELVRSSLVARDDMVDVERVMAGSAEEARDGTTRAVAL